MSEKRSIHHLVLDAELSEPLSSIDGLRLHVHDPETFDLPEPEDILDEINVAANAVWNEAVEACIGKAKVRLGLSSHTVEESVIGGLRELKREDDNE